MSFFKKRTTEQKRVYLDYASITPIDTDVLRVVTETHKVFFNPSSIHKDGVQAKKLLDTHRLDIARIYHVHPDEVLFTASGTESCVLALRGVVEKAKETIERPHIVITSIEHPAVLETARALEKQGIDISIVPVNDEGVVSVSDISNAIQDNTVLVSSVMTNNETGTIEPIRELSLLIKKIRKEKAGAYPLLHTDASQALVYEELDLRKIHVDLLSGDSIKCYGPRGIGMLFVRRTTALSTIMSGGGQEGGIRSGTENLPAIAGFACALKKAVAVRAREVSRLQQIKNYAWHNIHTIVPSAHINGMETGGSPHILNICFKGCDAEFVVLSLDALGISCSYASACKSLHGDSSSYVVEALGKLDCARSSIRFSFGRHTSVSDIDLLCDAIRELVHRGVIKK